MSILEVFILAPLGNDKEEIPHTFQDPDHYPNIQRNSVGLGKFRLDLNLNCNFLLSHSGLNEVNCLILSIPAYM